MQEGLVMLLSNDFYVILIELVEGDGDDEN